MSEALTPVIQGAVEKALAIPGVKVDREKYLCKNLSRYCSEWQLNDAIKKGTIRAGVPIETLDTIAKNAINLDTLETTAISAVTGIPGGLAMLGTIPADLAQFYAHILSTAQKLAYIYGWDDLSAFSDEAKSHLFIFTGVMSGVDYANKALVKLFEKQAAKIMAEKAAADAFAKQFYFPLLKIFAKEYALKRSTVDSSKLFFAKAVPFIGPAVSGALTLATFKPMANRLKKCLSDLAKMSPEDLRKYSDSIIIATEYREVGKK